jgi:thiol-disulfide isomerase/thioredoxin
LSQALSQHRRRTGPVFRCAAEVASAARGRGASRLQRRDLLRLFAAGVLVELLPGGFGPVAPAGASETRLRPWSGTSPTGVALDATTGARVAVDDARGRTVILHFFATWCEPCRAELVLLQEFADRREDLIVLAVDVGEVDARVKRFAGEIGWRRLVLVDRDRAVAHAFGVSALPTTIVLDPTLTPRLTAEGDLDWRTAAVTDPIVTLATPPPDGRRQACIDATC